MVTIDTSTSAFATAFSSQRKVDRTQNGVLWTFWFDGGTAEVRASYSQDDGATWSAAVSLTVGSATVKSSNFSVFIDVDDYLHVVWKQFGDDGGRFGGHIYYARGAPNTGRTSWASWSSDLRLVDSSSNYFYPDVVAHREGDGWKAHAVVSIAATSAVDRAWYSRVNISSGGAISEDTATSISGLHGNTNHKFPSIDFNHAGDAKTVAGSPHLYVAWSSGATGSGRGVRFRKATYSSGSWTWGTERGLDEDNFANAGRISSIFDGTRVVVAYAPSGSTATINIRERDAADTTTTARTPTALSDGTVEAVSVTYDGSEDIHLWAVGTTSDDVKRLVYDRSAGSWDTWTTVATADARPDTLTLKRGDAGSVIEAVYTDTTASPYNVVFASFELNSPPSASTWNTADNQAHDVNAGLTLDWNFVDPDDGDTQSAYALRRQIGSGSLEYWNAGTSAWGASEVKNTTTSTEVTLASGWGATTDDNHKYAVKTWDDSDAEGTYSSELTVVPSAKVNPTIDSPAHLSTLEASTVTVEWTVAEQSQYKIRLLDADNADAQVETTGWVTSSSARSKTLDTELDNNHNYKVELTTKNDDGLASDPDVNSFATSFTPPPTPTLEVVETLGRALRVDITNPTPGTGEPAVTGNRVFVRVAAGGQKDIDRPVGGDGLRIAVGVAANGSYTDWAVASTVVYEYKVRAMGDNGTTADSVWVSDAEAETSTLDGGSPTSTFDDTLDGGSA